MGNGSWNDVRACVASTFRYMVHPFGWNEEWLFHSAYHSNSLRGFAWFTFWRILGFIIGILMGEVTFLRKLLFPYIIASQAVPKLALAPLFILWFGFGMTSKVVITALVCFFPLLESTVTAIQSSDKQKQELFRMLGATRFQTLIHLKIPAGMPGILAGLRVSAVLAVVGAVVGEFIGGSEGLGALIIASQGMMDTPLMFATLILLTVMGMILYLMITWFEKKWLKPI